MVRDWNVDLKENEAETIGFSAASAAEVLERVLVDALWTGGFVAHCPIEQREPAGIGIGVDQGNDLFLLVSFQFNFCTLFGCRENAGNCLSKKIKIAGNENMFVTLHSIKTSMSPRQTIKNNEKKKKISRMYVVTGYM